MILHAGLVALRLEGWWLGAMIQGPSGAGKSDLALRALEQGFRLVADDRTLVWASGGQLFGRAPDALFGLIECRGQGIAEEPAIGFARIAVAVVCAGAAATPERMPEREYAAVAGLRVPRVRLDAREPSACAKLRRALRHLGRPRQEGYQAGLLGGGDRAGTGDTH